ncbi:Kelch-like protein 20 [Chelonia mydas]|uniref:Kelch-like protein 20 n=1 Tax=Chelonia mydas TaxID=8469 RepID=M7BFX5_CHEMY|nr:Kelch-like protein 20 [Chelonia mydas]
MEPGEPVCRRRWSRESRCAAEESKVLQHVRLPLLSPKFLVGTVGSDPLIKSDEECSVKSEFLCCVSKDPTLLSTN